MGETQTITDPQFTDEQVLMFLWQCWQTDPVWRAGMHALMVLRVTPDDFFDLNDEVSSYPGEL